MGWEGVFLLELFELGFWVYWIFHGQFLDGGRGMGDCFMLRMPTADNEESYDFISTCHILVSSLSNLSNLPCSCRNCHHSG